MSIAAWATASTVLSLLAWICLFFGRDGFWRAEPKLEAVPAHAPAGWPALGIVVPARNEALHVGEALTSLVRQDYPGEFRIWLVDDHSEDATRQIADDLAARAQGRLEVLAAPTLPFGWAGKLWALAAGLRRADEAMPQARYVLFTDADIAHAPGNLRQLVAVAEAEALDAASLMVRLRAQCFWEKLLIVPFVFFFQMLYPFPAVNDPARRTAAAAGGCFLIRRAALRDAGGIEAVRDRVIDDVALARAIKHRPGGGRIWLAHTARTRSLRGYDGLEGIWAMVVRSADVQLQHSLVLLALTVGAMALVYLVPPVVVLSASWHGSYVAVGAGALAWLAMALAYAPTARLYDLPSWSGAALPLAAGLFLAMTVDSALRYRRGRGGVWKGRSLAAAGAPPHGQKREAR